MKSFTLIIPAWNGVAFIGDCLSSLQPQLQTGDAIIVVDNGSTDGTPDLAERRFPSVQVLRQEYNLGYGGGANRGIARDRADAVVIMNQDIVLKEGCLAALRQRLEASGPSVIGAKLFYPDGRTIQHAGGVIRMPRGEPDHYGYRQIDDGSYDQVTQPDYVTGALFVIDRRVLETIGGFDEDFFPAYYEEADYCYRAREAGFPIIYEPGAVAVHYESQTFGQHSVPYYDAMSRGRLRFLLKHQTTAQFCDEFAPAERCWLTKLPSGVYRRILLHAYLHSMLMVPRLQTSRLLADPATASGERLLDALEQLSHDALCPM
jgi:O-antigen biosynthesis protein